MCKRKCSQSFSIVIILIGLIIVGGIPGTALCNDNGCNKKEKEKQFILNRVNSDPTQLFVLSRLYLKTSDDSSIESQYESLSYTKWRREFNLVKKKVTLGYIGCIGGGMCVALALVLSNTSDKEIKAGYRLVAVLMGVVTTLGIIRLVIYSPKLKRLKKTGRENGYLVHFNISPTMNEIKGNMVFGMMLSASTSF